MITLAHSQRLQFNHGLPEALVKSLKESGEVCSLSPSEVRNHLGRLDIDSSGFLIKYPGNGFSTIRLDNPPSNEKGRPQKYLRRAGEPNSLYIPSGLDLAQAGEIWITEGELKALCGHAYGLPVVALSGVWLKMKISLMRRLSSLSWLRWTGAGRRSISSMTAI